MAEFDLHLHSHWSYDANAPVEYYFHLAEERGARAIAITDHHTMDSLPDVLAAAERHPSVRFIPGAELTCHTSIGPVDLVCLGLPPATPPELEAIFDRYRRWQCAFGEATSRAMIRAGFPYGRAERLELLRRYRPEAAIARQGVTHVNWLIQMAEFLRLGWLRPGEEAAFWRKITAEAEFPLYPPAEEVLPVVRRCGGLVFIAHPLHYFLRDDRRRMDRLREELGFDGIECAHTMIPPELTECYSAYARRHGLLRSAGSDCHSSPEHYRLNAGLECHFARHCGAAAWLDEIEERLGH